MAYRIEAGEEPVAALRRIAWEQIESAVASIDDGDLDRHDTAHDVRKRCKKIRALLRLVRSVFDPYDAENAWFRDTARRLAPVRDATTLVEGCRALAARFEEDLPDGALDAVQGALVERRDAVCDSLDAGETLGEVRDALEAAAGRVESWSLDAEGFDALAGGLAKTYRRARRGMERARAEPTTANLHEWRKRVKYHRYHLRLLAEAWPDVMTPLRDAAHLLSDRLGNDHDLALLHETLVDETGRFDAGDRKLLLGLVEHRRKELQAWAFPLGQRLLAEKPKRLVGRLRQAWEAWTLEQRLAAALPEGSAAVA